MLKYDPNGSIDEKSIMRVRKLCRRLTFVFRVIQTVLLAATTFSLCIAVLIRYGIFPAFLMNIRDTVPAAVMNITFPMRLALPLQDLGKNDMWAVYMGSTGILLFVWVMILELLRRTFRDIAAGMSPFQKQLVGRFKWGYVLIAVMALGQPVFFLAIPVLMVCHYIFIYGGTLEKKASATIDEQEQVIVSLAEITEQKSAQTGQHVKRVSEYSRILAGGMGLSEGRVEIIRQASMLHDIGKLMIDSSILEKPGKLTPEEFEIIKKHVTYGGQLLETTQGDLLQTARIIALEHHERWDGKGYAQGKEGEDISLEGRIVAVADVFDALVSRRSYKEAWTEQDAYDEIVKQSGKQFDPDVVNVFKNDFEQFKTVLAEYGS